MSLFHEAFDALDAVTSKFEDLTIDQQLKVAEIKALLAISQELSGIHHEGINPQYQTGN